jgi:hypothetical protein
MDKYMLNHALTRCAISTLFTSGMAVYIVGCNSLPSSSHKVSEEEPSGWVRLRPKELASFSIARTEIGVALIGKYLSPEGRVVSRSSDEYKEWAFALSHIYHLKGSPVYSNVNHAAYSPPDLIRLTGGGLTAETDVVINPSTVWTQMGPYVSRCYEVYRSTSPGYEMSTIEGITSDMILMSFHKIQAQDIEFVRVYHCDSDLRTNLYPSNDIRDQSTIRDVMKDLSSCDLKRITQAQLLHRDMSRGNAIEIFPRDHFVPILYLVFNRCTADAGFSKAFTERWNAMYPRPRDSISRPW